MRLSTLAPWLGVFLSGFVSGAALLGLWPRADGATRAPTPPARPLLERASLSRAPVEDGTGHAPVAGRDPLPPPEAVPSPSEEPPADRGASVGDLLARLEAAYAAESSDEVAPTEVDPLPEAPAEAQIERETVTIDDGTDAADNAPSLVAENDAEPPSEDGPANQIHVSEVENVSVQNGDVTIGGQTRVQNLTVVQYLDLVGRTLEAGRPYPTPAIRGTASPPTQKGPPWPGALTNPDNPWGFDFPPTPLVK